MRFTSTLVNDNILNYQQREDRKRLLPEGNYLYKFAYKYNVFLYDSLQGKITELEYKFEQKFTRLRQEMTGVSEAEYPTLVSSS